MPRTTKTITFSLPPEMAERVDEVMKQEGRTRSELLREALIRYVEECEWRALLQYGEQRARELGMSLRDLADRVGVSYSYMSQVARGRRNMGVKVQARVESALEAPVKIAPAQAACIDREAMWDRMNAHGISQNEAARRAGINSAHLSQIMNGRNNPSPVVLKKLHGVLFQPTKAERVMPAGAAVRVGGRVPWGAKAEFAYRAGYDGTGRVSVTHVVERGYSAMLTLPELRAA